MGQESGRVAGKRVLIGVTGGIAAYKTLDVIGRLREEGADARVVMTRAATNFVTPLSFQARSGAPVYTDMWEPAQSHEIEHIEYARWADLFLVAPATANAIAKFAHGLADDPLSTLYLAYDGTVLVAPAMNTVMYEHPATRANIDTLAARGVEFVGPASGVLACGEVGPGKMAAVEDVVEAAVEELTKTAELEGRRVLITAGPTREHIDPARFLTNPSTGKMGYALAAEARRRGADVTIVSGPTACRPPRGADVKNVLSAEEMYEATVAAQDGADILIFCAAVADFTPKNKSQTKLKKTGEEMTLELTSTKDIALETSKRARPDQLRVGFAAETNDLVENALAKVEKKGLDFVVANDISDPSIGFASDENRVCLIDRSGGRQDLETMSKSRLAQRLFDTFVPAWRAKKS